VRKPKPTPNQVSRFQPDQPVEKALNSLKLKLLPLYEEYLRLNLSSSEAAAVVATLLREDDDTVRELLDLPEEPLEKTLAAFKTGMAKLKQIPGNSPSRSRIPQGIPEAELTKAYHFSLRKPGIHP
jgi:mevalonate kinase